MTSKTVESIPCECNGTAELTTVFKVFGDTIYEVELYKCIDPECNAEYMSDDQINDLIISIRYLGNENKI